MSEDNEMSWDLSVLFDSFDNPQINKTLEKAKADSRQFEYDYKGKINTPTITAKNLIEIINQMEVILQSILEVDMYVDLTIASDQTNNQALALRDAVQTTSSLIQKYLAFFQIEVGELLNVRGSEFLDKVEFREKKHYLEKIQRKHTYILSELEEKIIIEKDQYGIDSWSQLQRQWLATRQFTVNVHGEEKTVSWSLGNGLFRDRDRAVRKEAIIKILGGLGEDAELFATALRNFCGDHVTESKRRGYNSTMESSLIANDITQDIIINMLKAVESNLDLFQEFLLLKARILGTNKLLGEDLEAPLPFDDDREVSWSEAREKIIEGYQQFDAEFGTITRGMFSNHRIDSAPRSNKSAGAFCTPWYKGQSAFIIQSFNGKMDNMRTLAHEMGHAIHAHYASVTQSYLNLYPSMLLAETASEFGTLLFTKKLANEAPNDDLKKAILFSTVENIMTLIFEVGSRIRFEERLYAAIENGDFLNEEKINKLFWEARVMYFGDTVEWHSEQAYHWCWKPHYYVPKFRFYNYPYVFGELLVLALYNKYHEEGEDFIPKYKNFLAAGGCKSVEELGKDLGVDLTSPEFWETGFAELQRLFNELRALYN
ncbi:MAG: M3 family oligoendopeptidase [Candidatus Hodarchaeales archaeon]|jgi:oligoendopeptidase F